MTTLEAVVRRTEVYGMVNGLVGHAILFGILAPVSAVLGARGVAGLSLSIAKCLIVLVIVPAILSLLP